MVFPYRFSVLAMTLHEFSEILRIDLARVLSRVLTLFLVSCLGCPWYTDFKRTGSKGTLVPDAPMLVSPGCDMVRALACCVCAISGSKDPGPWSNIKMSSYEYRKSHCGDKTVVRSSYLHNGISYTCKMASLYWFGPWSPFQYSIRRIIKRWVSKP